MKHPVIEGLEQLERPAASARALGYRMPAEWEPHDAVWLSRPEEETTWPGCLDEARAQFDALVEAASDYVTVETTAARQIGTDDAWIRDYGPVFVVDDAGKLGCHDFTFNCWGGKYGPWADDNLVPQHIARHVGAALWVHDFVLEGGSIEVNGVGTVLTTEQCLLHPNRNPLMAREQIEWELHEALGTRQVVWLVGGIEGDDTDGHVDTVARFVNPRTIVATRAPQGHPDHLMLERNWQVLTAARDQDGRGFELLELPVPEPMHHVFPADEWGIGGRRILPASHANFLLTNRCALVPTFGQKSDDVALRVLEAALPGYRVVGLPCAQLAVGLGGLHCISQQQPRIRRR